MTRILSKKLLRAFIIRADIIDKKAYIKES